MTQSKQRKKQFFEEGAGQLDDVYPLKGIAWQLSQCSYYELSKALEDREKNNARSKDNHYSIHSLGSIILVVCAFDAWMNENLTPFRHFLAMSDEYIEEMLNSHTDKKYQLMAKYVREDFEIPSNLKVIVDLRDELIHFVPRVIIDKENLPSWLKKLSKLSLLIKTDSGKDYMLTDKLGSYKLAYWVWEELYKYAEELASMYQKYGRGAYDRAQDFKAYINLTPPNKLS